VEHVKAKGWPEDKAWAICKSRLGDADDIPTYRTYQAQLKRAETRPRKGRQYI